MAKTTTSAAISSEKNAVTATMKKKMASTWPAWADAASGKNGKFVNIVRFDSPARSGPRRARGAG